MMIQGYLILSAILLTLGVVMFVSRKNTIAILMGVELMMNAAALNFVAFSHFTPSMGSPLDGQVFAIFIILIAAAEAVVALAIAMAAYKEFKHAQADRMTGLSG